MQAAPHRADVELLTRVVNGEPDAVRALLDDTGDVLYGYVFARVGGNTATAEDIVQETFVEAMRSAHTFRGDSSVRTWLCTIARRRLARFYEAERRSEVARSGLRLVEDDTADEEVEVDQRDEVVRALGALSPLHRQVLVLKYLDDRSVEDIAEELGRTRVQVQSMLQRARVGLRKALEGSE